MVDRDIAKIRNDIIEVTENMENMEDINRSVQGEMSGFNLSIQRMRSAISTY